MIECMIKLVLIDCFCFEIFQQNLNYSSQGLGYDHNYILRGSVAYDVPAGLQPVAKAAS